MTNEQASLCEQHKQHLYSLLIKIDELQREFPEITDGEYVLLAGEIERGTNLLCSALRKEEWSPFEVIRTNYPF